ncbi:cation-transporting P-type ATPase [Guyparkeria sp. SCN-R1]|uniref:cation-translocating P-type ATPase n=1 Tax=Guyparkeria sp. SCN-R1 TaxID=2341113 RepID=UPI000F648E62|nr:cation-transporting P-type ATPase [Guyparkeria sp. SCN-R1]RRQ23840.1 cation-transporting P-type ATPase [Guyparkeria sp. SCN-R1]
MPRPLPPNRLELLATPEAGLTSMEAGRRLSLFGPNRIIEATAGSWVDVLKSSVTDPMLWFLLASSLLFAWLGDLGEAMILLVALLPLLAMDAWLHRRTQASTAGLKSKLAATARVRRDGSTVTRPAAELVPGDRVLLSAGEPVPADGLLVRVEGLQVDESLLTGESYPLRKATLPPNTLPGGLPDEANWVQGGTRVLAGSGEMLVVHTGAETSYGEIVRSAARGRQERTPLQQAVAALVRTLIVAALAFCLVLAWVRLEQGHGLVDALLSAVTLAIAALPEEFPVVLTFFLGVGIYRLARRKALVRRAVVVENIGRVSTICTDKTGTLTEGRLELTHRLPVSAHREAALLRAAALASRAEGGDPMDVALLAIQPPMDPAFLRLTTFPFTEERRCEISSWRAPEGHLVAAMKGAPETVFARCELTPPELEHWHRETDRLAGSGQKVVAVAERRGATEAPAGQEPTSGFTFLGLLAFGDPLRGGVTEAIAQCREAGLRVIMVTGDHRETAMAIARQLGIGGDSPRVLSGEELDEALDRSADHDPAADVIARATPMQKLALVQRLRALGEVVAVTGDGVNDVPALQAADIGIAMGQRGTRSAREVASIVLLDDNFRSLVQAIGEGRQLFANLQRSFQYLLMIHIPLVVTAAAIPLAGHPLLYLPLHIVWLELIIHPTALLAFQARQSARPLMAGYRPPDNRFFDRREWLAILGSGLLLTAVVIAGVANGLHSGQGIEHARSIALVMLTFASALIAAVLSGLRDRLSRGLVAATAISAIVLVQVPPVADLLHLQPLHWDDWLIATSGALAAASLAAVNQWRRRPPKACIGRAT